MDHPLQPICPSHAPCKCCGTRAPLFGVVDFHKHSQLHYPVALGVSGIPIYYYRCPGCGFIFSTAFDHFTMEDFHRWIYNEDYLQVDRDFLEARPRTNAAFLYDLLARQRPQVILDYGGGNGLLAEMLRATGFRADTYDPFVAQFAERPQQRYDCIVSFEVAEHSTDPAHTFADMNELLQDPGVIIFSTLIQPDTIEKEGLNWWYAGPRNGHVSLYTRASLLALGQPHGLQLASLNDNLHLFYRNIPDFAKSFIRVV